MFMENILVCIKAVPIAAQSGTAAQETLQREKSNLQWNIADEAALEAALRLRSGAGTVTVLTMGPAKLADPLRELLGRGVDRAVLLTDPCLSGADTYATTRALSAAIRALGSFDLILCGRRAVDGETGQVPPMLAASMDMPCITNVEDMAEAGGRLTLRRRLEDRAVTVSVSSPAVVSVCEYAYCLRLPGIAAMRRAREKQVQQLTAAGLGLSPEVCGLKGSLTRVVHTDKKFPGLRSCKKETDLSSGAHKLLELCGEVGVCVLP